MLTMRSLHKAANISLKQAGLATNTRLIRSLWRSHQRSAMSTFRQAR